jgi:hypothetical protein
LWKAFARREGQISFWIVDEDLGLHEQSQIAGEVQLAMLKSRLETGHELATKHTTGVLGWGERSEDGIESSRAVQETVARCITDVFSGELDPRVAAGVAPLLNLLLRVMHATDLEPRLAKLEQMQASETVQSPDDKL